MTPGYIIKVLPAQLRWTNWWPAWPGQLHSPPQDQTPFGLPNEISIYKRFSPTSTSTKCRAKKGKMAGVKNLVWRLKSNLIKHLISSMLTAEVQQNPLQVRQTKVSSTAIAVTRFTGDTHRGQSCSYALNSSTATNIWSGVKRMRCGADRRIICQPSRWK